MGSERPWWLDVVRIGQEYSFHGGQFMPYGWFIGRVWDATPTHLYVETHGEMIFLDEHNLDGAIITPIRPPSVRLSL